MGEITGEHLDFLDTFYEEPRTNADIGDDADTWALIDDLVAAGYLDDGGDDGEEVAITSAGIDLLDEEDDGEEDGDGDDEAAAVLYRSYFHDADPADTEEWPDLDHALWACNNYIDNGAEPGDAAILVIETGEAIDIYDFLDEHVEN